MRVALDMVLHVHNDHPKKRSKNGSFSPQNGPPLRSIRGCDYLVLFGLETHRCVSQYCVLGGAGDA